MLDHKNNIETTPCVDGASATNPVVSISVVFLWMQVLHACIARKSLKFTWKNFRLIFRFAILGCMWTYKKLLVAAAFGFHWRPIVFFFIIIIILFATIFFAIKTFYDSFRRYLSKCLTLFFPVSLLIPPYNLRFYDVFRGVKKKQWKENG